MPSRLAIAAYVAAGMGAFAAGALDGGALVFYSDSTAAPIHADDALPTGAVELVRVGLPIAGAAIVDSTADAATVTLAPLAPVDPARPGRIGWAVALDAAGHGVIMPNVGTVDEALLVTSLDVAPGTPFAVVLWAFTIPTIFAE